MVGYNFIQNGQIISKIFFVTPTTQKKNEGKIFLYTLNSHMYIRYIKNLFIEQIMKSPQGY